MTLRLPLTTVTIFKFLSPDHTKRLGQIAKVIDKSARDAILVHGETVPGIYVVGQGSVGVYPQGALAPIAHLNRGDSFGEMSFLEGGVASATIRAETDDTKIIILLQSEVADFTIEDPTFGRALYRGIAFALSQKLRHTTEKISAEIRSSRRLFEELVADDGGLAIDLAGLPDAVVNQNHLVMSGLDNCMKLLQDAGARSTDKTSSAGQIAARLEEVKGLYVKFYPRLARQLVAIMNFIKSIESSLMQARRD